jgi:hypothetical protein
MLLLAVGFTFAMPWATRLWPWPDGPLSYLFVGSILAAFGSGSLLVAWRKDWRAAAGGAIALVLGFGAMGSVLAWIGFAGFATGSSSSRRSAQSPS